MFPCLEARDEVCKKAQIVIGIVEFWFAERITNCRESSIMALNMIDLQALECQGQD